jgi:plastocyanin
MWTSLQRVDGVRRGRLSARVSRRAVPLPPAQSKKRRNLSISTVIILVLAAVAGIAYYVGTPASLPSPNASSDSCPSQSVQMIIPQGVGTNSSIHFEPPTLVVVVGINNTVIWNDQDSTAAHDVISVSVPPNGVQFYIDGMSAGNTYCVTLSAPGTYTYEVFLPYIVEGTIIVKDAS